MTAAPRERWFGREFGNDVLPSLAPNLITRLAGAPVRLEEMVGRMAADARTRRSREEWSVQENAGHLLDLESLWLARLDDFLNGIETLTPADLENTKTHEAGHNDRPIEGILAGFREERLGLVARLDALGAEAFSLTALHPRLQQPMRLIDLLVFVAEHDDHHLAKIRAAAAGA